MMRIILSVLLMQVIAASPTASSTSTTKSVINRDRNKKAVNVKESPIIYVQRFHEPGHDAKFTSAFTRPKRNRNKVSNKHYKKTAAPTNHDLLNSLGLAELPSPSNPHSKRLATQSRRVGRPDDSKIFVVKLPPNPYYYTQTSSFNTGVNDPNSIHDMGKKIPVGFKSNGKPAKIYHWNLPVLKKMHGEISSRSNSKKYKENKLRHNDFDIADLIDIKNIPTWSDTTSWHENDTIEKSSLVSFNVNAIHPEDHEDDDKRLKILKKKSSPSFYAPTKKHQKSQKYFPSNGKPKSFYVMKNSKSEKSFHNLID